MFLIRSMNHIYHSLQIALIKTILPKKAVDPFPPGTTILQNARQPLNIPTYDGLNQVVHPSVIDFLTEYGVPKWGGHRFWMVITPYPYGDDTYENPSIYVSDDGVNWFVPSNIKNPIVSAPGGWKRGFNNDPDLIYDPDADEIRVYYRFSSIDELNVKMINITKEQNVGEPKTIIVHSPWTQMENTHRSLCIWRESSKRWHMWGGGGAMIPPHNIYYRFSEDGIHWSSPERCVDDSGEDPFQALGYTNWHMSCKANYYEKRVEFFSYANSNSSRSNGAILYAECSMDNPKIIRTSIVNPILLPSKKGWDNGQLYRCSFNMMDAGDRYYYRVWYSASSDKNVWKLGYTGGYVQKKPMLATNKSIGEIRRNGGLTE